MQSKPAMSVNLKSPYYSLLSKLLNPSLPLSLGDFKINQTIYKISTDLDEYSPPSINTNFTTIILTKDQKDLDFQIILYQILNPEIEIIPMEEAQLPNFINGLMDSSINDDHGDERLDEITVLQNLGLSEHGKHFFNT